MARQNVSFFAGQFCLEGLLDLPDVAIPAPAVVMCHPHPLYGGTMFDAVVDLVCRSLLSASIATLRFNFRGAGGSQGEHEGGVGERDDVWAALDFLRTCDAVDSARLGLAGYSFGAAVALNSAAAAGVRALELVSLPPRMLDFSAQLGIEIPVLIIAGDQDAYAPAERLQQLVPALGADVRLEVVPGIDHFWARGGVRLQEASAAFFGAVLRAPERAGPP